MLQPAKPESSSKPSEGDQAAGSSIVDAVAGVALQESKKKQPTVDPDKKWEEMGAELYTALEKKDQAGFGRLFIKQVRLAVKEALRGNK